MNEKKHEGFSFNAISEEVVSSLEEGKHEAPIGINPEELRGDEHGVRREVTGGREPLSEHIDAGEPYIRHAR